MFRIFSVISAFMLTSIVPAQTTNYELKKEKRLRITSTSDSYFV